MSLPTNDGVSLWQTEAKCSRIASLDLFFDKARKAEREAKKICAGCPVIAECLEQALVYNYEGVWGGTSAKERRSLKLRNTAKYLREDYKESGLYNAALKV